MMRTLSFVEALEGRTPTNSLNDFAIVNSADFATGRSVQNKSSLSLCLISWSGVRGEKSLTKTFRG
jgi:hypothetical protein